MCSDLLSVGSTGMDLLPQEVVQVVSTICERPSFIPVRVYQLIFVFQGHYRLVGSSSPYVSIDCVDSEVNETLLKI